MDETSFIIIIGVLKITTSSAGNGLVWNQKRFSKRAVLMCFISLHPSAHSHEMEFIGNIFEKRLTRYLYLFIYYYYYWAIWWSRISEGDHVGDHYGAMFDVCLDQTPLDLTLSFFCVSFVVSFINQKHNPLARSSVDGSPLAGLQAASLLVRPRNLEIFSFRSICSFRPLLCHPGLTQCIYMPITIIYKTQTT